MRERAGRPRVKRRALGGSSVRSGATESQAVVSNGRQPRQSGPPVSNLRPFHTVAAVLAAACSLASCSSADPSASSRVRRAIGAVIAQRVQATRARDIDAFLATVPSDIVLQDESGARMTLGQLRTNILREWSVIKATRSLAEDIDSLALAGDTATVFTTQRWDRLMLERDGATIDTVVTTEHHREIWRRTPAGWRAYSVVELGGTVTVNGKPYPG